MRSLRRFIAVSLIALAALPSLLTALFAGQLIKANVTAGIEASLSALAGSVAMESELYLRTSTRLLDALSRFLGEGRPLGEDRSRGAVQGFVSSLAASHEEVSAMVLLDERGRVEVIAPENGPVLGDDFSRQPAYMAARRSAGGEAVFSTPYISPIDGKVTVAVYRNLGNRTGLVLLALDRIGRFFEGLRVSPRDAVALVDGDNRFIAHTDSRHVEEQRYEFRSRERGMAETGDDGREFLLLSRKVPGHEWKALYYRDREEAYALLGGFTRRLAALAVAATLLALLVAARAGRAMTSPFSDISAKMREVAAGRYSDRIGGRWSEEFDAIAETFNTMAESVERRDLALSASEARYRSLFYDSLVPSLLVDPATGAIREANATAAAFYGYLPEELTALRMRDIDILPARRLRAEMAKSKAARRERLLFRHRRKDGAFRDVEVYS
ncbi:MAG: PAS domain S-box protein, partial [Spirochaetaceae bacterium]|nr:PAS domain S-box protein [Spirochaetaceae bacterium]